jgi:hypothetical protein
MSLINKYKKEINRWALSSLDTFLSAFIPTLILGLQTVHSLSDLTWTFVSALLVGAGLAGVRAVLKAIRENLMQKYNGKT